MEEWKVENGSIEDQREQLGRKRVVAASKTVSEKTAKAVVKNAQMTLNEYEQAADKLLLQEKS